jgi:Subtilase family/PatG C-terminal
MTRAKPSALVPRRPGKSPSHVSRCRASSRGPQYQVASGAVTSKTCQATGASVAVIDGPYDATALFGILPQAPVSLGTASCQANPSSACDHGTFIIGLLGARQDAVIPGLCPSCTLLHVPLFIDHSLPSAGVGELANAIRVAVAAGARLINLSLAILGDDTQYDHKLAAALDYAEANDVVVLVAAGNQGRLAMGQLLSHPATIPVVATDAAGRLLPENNFGPTISRRGIAALGHQILGYAPGASTTVMSGTSVATAVATGTLAELWSLHPSVTGGMLRTAVALLTPRNGFRPPMLDRNLLSAMLERTHGTMIEASAATLRGGLIHVSLQGEPIMDQARGLSGLPSRAMGPAAGRPNVVTPSNGADACACGAGPGEACACAGKQATRSGFVYAIGTVEAEYPNVAIEREMQIMGMGIEVEPEVPTKLTEDRHWQHAVLTRDRKRTRYLARQLSWRLTIEDLPAFVLKPRDCCDIDDLIDCLNRPKYPKPERGKGKKGKAAATDPIVAQYGLPQDLDVIVGVSGDKTSDGLEVYVDQIFEIPSERLSLPIHGYFPQMVDNYGLADEDRAYNFLAARYDLSARVKEIEEKFELTGVPAIYSRLSGDADRVVRVIFTFRSHNSLIEKRYFVRVDVTHEFPTIITPWQPYLERGDAS